MRGCRGDTNGSQASIFPRRQPPSARAIRDQISRRLNLLQELGLEYLQLNRRADTLSSGEFQRLRLGSALSSGTTQMLYVLDEPSAGFTRPRPPPSSWTRSGHCATLGIPYS